MRDEAMVQRLSRAYMRSSIVEQLGLGLALVVLPLATGCLDEDGLSLESTAAAAPGNFETNSLETSQPAQVAASEDQLPDLELSTAPAKTISTPRPPPSNLHLTSSLSGLVRLAESGVEDGVMLAFVNNSRGTFSLGSEEIIYLNDLGVPAPVITAMLQHDHVMLSEAANAALAALPAQPEPAAAAPPSRAAEPAAEPEPTPATEPVTEFSAGLPPAEPSDTVFYDTLAPYGTWVNVGGYGLCWQPSAVAINPSWRPYCDRGHWVYTDCGWYWMSDYSWGWAPFHYGRWFCHASLGWCWAPDRVWGPSWVCWRYSNDFCGWAPLPPAACFRPGLGFIYGGHSVGFSFNFGVAASWYTFVPLKNFCDYRLARFAVPHDRTAALFNQSVAVNKIVGDPHRIFNAGVPADRVAAATRRTIRPAIVREASVAAVQGVRGDRLEAGGRTLTVFRPRPTPVPRTPGSPAEVVTADGGSMGVSTAAPLVIRGSGGAALPATAANFPNREPNTMAERTVRPGQGTPTVSRAPQPQTGRDPRLERAAPLIIRGSKQAPQAAATPNLANRDAMPTQGQNSRTEFATRAPRISPQASQWAPARLVEAQPRLERAAANDALESRARRYQLQSRRGALPEDQAPGPGYQQPTVPTYQPPTRPMPSNPERNFAPPPGQTAREMPATRQPISEARPTPAASAPAASAPAHGNVSQGGASSDKRGR